MYANPEKGLLTVENNLAGKVDGKDIVNTKAEKR